MYSFSDIRSLQVEITNYCNAACPQCPRNFFGGSTIPTLPLQKWSSHTFKKVIPQTLLLQLEQIYFCGTYGDPFTNSALLDICKFVKDTNPRIKVGIHTNGGAGSASVFSQIASYCDFIAFGIDGLEHTNHIYRRHVRWAKVLENTAAFISAGGNAIWDFIVFRHNQHQVEEARQLSQTLGFKDFVVKRTGRFLNRRHVYSDTAVVFNKYDKVEYTIAVPTDPQYINQNYKIVNSVDNLNDYARKTCISCNAQRINEIYIGADGFVFPCGWLHDRLYGPEIEVDDDHVGLKKLMAACGGWTQANIHHVSLEEIVNGPWFATLEKSWTDNTRLSRCGIMCGQDLNLIGEQNLEVQYKK